MLKYPYSNDWKKNPRCTGPEPYVPNYPDLLAWLEKNGAVCNWQLARGRPGPGYSFLESWSAEGTTDRSEERGHRTCTLEKP